MTADTSRAAVEALITEWHNSKGKSGYTGRGDRLADALAALLDERDAAEEKYRSWLADRNRQKERADDAEQRIRDLEATVDNLRLISNANGDWNIKYQEVNHRAERAEAERDEARTALDTQMSYVDRALAAEAERDRIKAEYDADFPCDGGCNVNDGPDETCSRHGRRVSEVWEAWRDAASERDKLAAKLDAVKAVVTGWNGFTGLTREVLAILDTNEPKETMMTIDTSREAVQALIARLRDEYYFGTPDTLQDLLDERDRLAANRDAWVSDAMTSTTELEQRTRDLKAEVKSLDNFLHLAREAAKQNLERAERAEAELLHARGISEIREYERDKLAAKLDAVKAWATRDLERAQPKYGEYAEGLLVAQEVVRAILADTDEGNDK